MTQHRQARISAPPWTKRSRISVDADLAPLLRELWQSGFITFASCQDFGATSQAQIVFACVDMAQEFARIAGGPTGWDFPAPPAPTKSVSEWLEEQEARLREGQPISTGEWPGNDVWLQDQAIEADVWRFELAPSLWPGGELLCRAYFPREIVAKASEKYGRGSRT
jgi:hypothetical protein